MQTFANLNNLIIGGSLYVFSPILEEDVTAAMMSQIYLNKN